MRRLTHTSIRDNILTFLKGGDILFIIPPVGSIDDITLGPHNLQALAKDMGYKADILYLNILLASVIGEECYNKIYKAPLYWMIGDRLFARSAYGLAPLGKNSQVCSDEGMSIRGSKKHVKMFYGAEQNFDRDFYLKLEEICCTFMDEVISVILSLHYKIIGCTSTAIGQNNCSITLFKGIKKFSPETITIMGGSNCDGKMAEGIGSLSDAVDYIFSGESEITFTDFLKDYSADKLPCKGILVGDPHENLDNIPFPDFDSCLKQYRHFLGKDPVKTVRIWYETSRGCWWADRVKRCTFCSIHVESYRQKSVDKVLQEIKRSKTLYPNQMLFMTDNIMPHSYLKELLPLIMDKEEFSAMGYQLRADLDFFDLLHLKRAKINAILPGIEALSSDLLNMMKKGITARQNMMLLRNGRSIGIFLDWNIIWGLPGDSISDYKHMLEILPLIRHLQPPNNFTPLLLMRFSPYLFYHREYKIKNIQPWAVFDMIYPAGSKIDNLATYYIGEYPSGALENAGIIQQIAEEIDIWRKQWVESKLVMNHLEDIYVVYDNRDIHPKEKTHVLDYQRAKEVMTYCVYRESETQNWAVEQKLGIVLDSWYVPLVIASPKLLLEFEEKPFSKKRELC